jgi:hypothetical protein
MRIGRVSRLQVADKSRPPVLTSESYRLPTPPPPARTDADSRHGEITHST